MNLTKGEIRQQQIFDTAAKMFAEKGYARTSIRDLSLELGMQKSSLYHYFESKEDLLHRLLDEFMEEALKEIYELCEHGATPLDRLAGLMRFYTSFYAGHRERLMLLVNDLDCLSEERRIQVVNKERLYVGAIKGILDDLREAGLLRDIPTSVAAFAFFGMVHWTPRWYRPDGQVSPEELGQLFQTIFSHGVLKDLDGDGRPLESR